MALLLADLVEDEEDVGSIECTVGWKLVEVPEGTCCRGTEEVLWEFSEAKFGGKTKVGVLQLLSIGKLYSLVLLSELDLVLLAGELLLLPLTVALLFVEGPDIDGFLLDLAEELVDNDRFVAVSYTHLDVYKRQA